MKNSKKRGFTIVELVIVIAVIAILAGVLIPTFVSVIKKANESADIQACREMNTHLATSKVLDGVDNIADVITALNKENIDLDNYKPLTSGRMFYWYKTENRILYVDSNNAVIYPEEYKSLNLASEKGVLYSLSGEIKLNDYTISESSEVAVSDAGQFASFINDYNKGKNNATDVTKITLNSDIDLAGATYVFKNESGIRRNLEIDGNGHTIYGIRDDSNSYFGTGEFANKGYGYGLFSKIPKGVTVILKNTTFSGMSIGDTLQENGMMGLIAGQVFGTLEIENVTIKDSRVEGYQKIAGIAGWLDINATLKMTNVTMTNVEVAGACQVAKIVGYILNSDANKFVCNNVDVSGVSAVMSKIYTVDIVEEIAGKDITVGGVAQTGKLYAKVPYTNATWINRLCPLVTEEYYWKVVSNTAMYKGESFRLLDESSSANIGA